MSACGGSSPCSWSHWELRWGKSDGPSFHLMNYRSEWSEGGCFIVYLLLCIVVSLYALMFFSPFLYVFLHNPSGILSFLEDLISSFISATNSLYDSLRLSVPVFFCEKKTLSKLLSRNAVPVLSLAVVKRPCAFVCSVLPERHWTHCSKRIIAFTEHHSLQIMMGGCMSICEESRKSGFKFKCISSSFALGLTPGISSQTFLSGF